MAEALSLVERGWRGARACSLALQQQGVAVTHLIKGSVPAEVLGMVRPYPLIRLVAVPRPLFRVWFWLYLLRQAVTRRPGWVLIDNERTLQELRGFCRRFGLALVVVQELAERYELSVEGRTVPLGEAFGLAGVLS